MGEGGTDPGAGRGKIRATGIRVEPRGRDVRCRAAPSARWSRPRCPRAVRQGGAHPAPRHRDTLGRCRSPSRRGEAVSVCSYVFSLFSLRPRTGHRVLLKASLSERCPRPTSATTRDSGKDPVRPHPRCCCPGPRPRPAPANGRTVRNLLWTSGLVGSKAPKGGGLGGHGVRRAQGAPPLRRWPLGAAAGGTQHSPKGQVAPQPVFSIPRPALPCRDGRRRCEEGPDQAGRTGAGRPRPRPPREPEQRVCKRYPHCQKKS